MQGDGMEATSGERVTARMALREGDALTRLSALVMGAGMIGHRQVAKGLAVLVCEVSFVFFMVTSGWMRLRGFVRLGEEGLTKTWDEARQVFVYDIGDNSQLMLLRGVIALFVIAAIAVLWVVQMRHSLRLQRRMEEGGEVPTLAQDLRSLLDNNLHVTLMSLPCAGIVAFNVLPLVYMISMAFTTYSREGNHLVLFDWDGLNQFARVLTLGGNIGRQFWQVLGWTVVWAILATLLSYVLGMVLALLINRRQTRGKAFWRFCFVLSIAVPQFVTLMVMNIMLQPSGAVNVALTQLGLIDRPIPFWSDAPLARVTIVVINLWVGIPYTMLQVTGILQNIPQELFEAARVDGAGPARIFFKITLPYMLFVTTPYLIASFMSNINNFNVIYLLSGGGPTPVGDTAGKTDLLVTWLYKLTIDQQYYNLGAVIGIVTFVILTAITLMTYRHTGSYEDEEALM